MLSPLGSRASFSVPLADFRFSPNTGCYFAFVPGRDNKNHPIQSPSRQLRAARPRRIAGDTGYGAVRLLKWLTDRSIVPHVPVWDRSPRSDGTFSRADFLSMRSATSTFAPAAQS
jgi:hypothetical protein